MEVYSYSFVSDALVIIRTRFCRALLSIICLLMPALGFGSVQTLHPKYLDVGVQPGVSCAITRFFLQLAEENDLTLRLVITPLSEVSKRMVEGEFDVSAHGISNTNQSAPVHIASASKPYLKVMRGFTVLKTSEFASKEILPDGAKVAVMENSTAHQDLEKKYPDKFELISIPQLEGSPRRELKSGVIDAIAEGYTGFWFNPDDKKDFTMIDIHALDEDNPSGEALVFWVLKEGEELLTAINSQLHSMDENPYKYFQEEGQCNTRYDFSK